MERTSISFEFFPAKNSEELINLKNVALQLAKLSPEYFSVTYGAGGTTQEFSANTIALLRAETTINTAPHITCIGATKDKIAKLLDDYQGQHITHLVALRGDLPKSNIQADNDSPISALGDFQHADELVAFIRKHSGTYFHISVAAYPEFHPETKHSEQEFLHLNKKIMAGANSAITQYFFSSCAYFYLRDACTKLNIDVPIIPGIMPITNYKQLARFSATCGAEIPRWLRCRLESYGNDLESIKKFGEEVVTRLCEQLLAAGAPGLHFYTLNKAEPSIKILANLGY